MDNLASEERRANDYKAWHPGTKAAVNARLAESEQNSDQTDNSLRRDDSQGVIFVLRKFLQNQEITDAVRASVEATISKLEESFRETKGILRRNEKGVEAENVTDTQLSMDCGATGSNDSASKEGNQNNVGDLQSNALLSQLSSQLSKMQNDIDLLKKKVDDKGDEMENQIEDLKAEIQQIKSTDVQEVRSGASEKSRSTEMNNIGQTLGNKKAGLSIVRKWFISNENAGKKHSKDHSTSRNHRESPAESPADFYPTDKSSNEYTQEKHSRKHSMSGNHRESPAEDPLIFHHPNIIDTGLFSTQASPSALSTSVDNVKNRLDMYAKHVESFGTRRNLKLDYSTVGNENISNYLMCYSGPKTHLLRKCVIEAVVSEQIFQNFELPSFGGFTQGLFQKPDDFKMQRLHIYTTYKEEEPKTMYEQILEFNDFVNRKLLEVRNLITCKLFTESNEIEDGEREHLFHEKFELFLNLSKEVWLLHTLAFGCQPASAEIFRVLAGSSYMAQYMKEKEDTIGPPGSRQAADRIVACMTVPGFTLRSSIIPAEVCCVNSLTS